MTDPISLAAVGGAAWYLKKLVSPSAELLGEELRAQFEGFLGVNRRRVLERAAAMSADSAEQVEPIPLRLLLPILEKAGYEDDAFLQDRWAALLANAAKQTRGERISPAFVALLAQLTPMAAAVIELLDRLRVTRKPGNRWGVAPHDLLRELRSGGFSAAVAVEDVLLALNVAQAAGLVEREPAVREDGILGQDLVLTDRSDFRISMLGTAFVRAVTPPPPAS